MGVGRPVGPVPSGGKLRPWLQSAEAHRAQELRALVRKEETKGKPTTAFWASRSFQMRGSLASGEGQSLASVRYDYHCSYTGLKPEAQVTAAKGFSEHSPSPNFHACAGGEESKLESGSPYSVCMCAKLKRSSKVHETFLERLTCRWPKRCWIASLSGSEPCLRTCTWGAKMVRLSPAE